MLTFQLNFDIDEGYLNTFLIGSRSLFEKIEAIVKLFAQSIDVEVELTYKLIELENSNISYLLKIDIKYPLQMVFGNNINKDQIDAWFQNGLSLLLDKKEQKDEHNSLSELAHKTEVDLYFIYVEIPENILTKLLDDFEKLSILLFKRLVFFVK